jgi:hypothetical protein
MLRGTIAAASVLTRCAKNDRARALDGPGGSVGGPELVGVKAKNKNADVAFDGDVGVD